MTVPNRAYRWSRYVDAEYRANPEPWKEAASLNAQINLYGFWDATTFLTKSGDVGMVLRVGGVDYESLDSGEQEYAVKRLEAALKAFGPCLHVYQYLFKHNRPEIPFAESDDPVVARLSISATDSLMRGTTSR
jgi:type IV secretory pathway VirB4 component